MKNALLKEDRRVELHIIDPRRETLEGVRTLIRQPTLFPDILIVTGFEGMGVRYVNKKTLEYIGKNIRLL